MHVIVRIVVPEAERQKLAAEIDTTKPYGKTLKKLLSMSNTELQAVWILLQVRTINDVEKYDEDATMLDWYALVFDEMTTRGLLGE